MVLETLSLTQYDAIYNIFSFAVAAMGSATVFFLFQFSLVAKPYKTALVISALVTAIACYHYVRIFNSFTEGYAASVTGGSATPTDTPFNDAYRYVDWLLTVPLLLTELVLVMRLPEKETSATCTKLGLSAAIMVILGYPGEVSDDNTTRWVFWALAMLPFVYIVYTLFFGLRESIEKQPEAARGLVKASTWITVLSWCTYPIVFIFPMCGVSGATAFTGVQVGYSVADVIAKPILGLLVWKIASVKSAAEENEGLLNV